MIYAYAVAGCALAAVFYSFLKASTDYWLAFRSTPPPGAFRGQVVWIVGASQGLGEELALYFARQGALLILSSRRKDQLERVRDRCIEEGPGCRVEVLPLDITSKYGLLQARPNALSAAGSILHLRAMPPAGHCRRPQLRPTRSSTMPAWTSCC